MLQELISKGRNMMGTTIQQPQSQDLSPEEREQRAEVAREIEENIKESLAHGRAALWDLARYLYEFDQEQGWLSLGYEKQSEWLAQPDIGMTRVAFFRAVRKWRELVIYREIPMEILAALEPSKVDIVLPAIQDNRVKPKEAFDDVESLGARDLREKYVGTRPPGPEPTDEGGDIIEGTAKTIQTDEGPVRASDVEVSGSNGTEAEAETAKVVHAGQVVDSWVEMGGDKRKAQRNWRKFVELHPALVAVNTVDSYFAGDEEVTKEDVKSAWQVLAGSLGLDFSS